MFIEVNADGMGQGEAKLCRLWTKCLKTPGFLYKELSRSELYEKFLRIRPGIHKLALLHESGKAFAAGTFVDGEHCAYVTMVLTDPECRRMGLGMEILSALEHELAKRFGVREIRAVFFNPVTLPWNIPGQPGCEHPNAPGVDMESGACSFFNACGYQGFAVQCSYFRRLEHYVMPESVLAIRDRLLDDGYRIRNYDPGSMYGMKEMLDRLHNRMWNRSILGEMPPAEGGRPILVPEKDGRVLGFAGPLDVETSGRGYFAGIAVDEDARGRGIAKVLFASLCQDLRGKGAGYMTLFTGKDNPARRIYEAAGFEVVRTWENMKKRFPE